MKKYKDHYFNRAKQEQYPARSVYKLKEMDKRFQLLQKGQYILDLGAYPGSWSMFAGKRIGGKGRVLAVDRAQPEQVLPDNVEFHLADVLEGGEELERVLEGYAGFHLVLSDMAPLTTGIKIRDQALSLELAERALEFAQKHLHAGGSTVIKVFEGPDVPDFRKELKTVFTRVRSFKPKGSRSESKENFLLGLGRRKIDSDKEE
jgi:23S rRNA (uridine2552-2'-O)-methyltransferase